MTFDELDDLKKNRSTFGDQKKSSLFNSWRSKVYNKKGKLIGFPKSWETFEGFKNDIPDGFQEGYILIRKDFNKPYSKENTYWIKKEQQGHTKLVMFTHNNETKTLMEWAKQYDISYSGLRNRYFKGKDYTSEEILFGKKYNPKRKLNDLIELDEEKKRLKVSKMFTAYRHRDSVKGRKFDLTREFLSDLLQQECVYCGDNSFIGADRIDNNLGHLQTNVVPCCYTCNIARSNLFTYDEMLLLGKTIKQIKLNRSHGNK